MAQIIVAHGLTANMSDHGLGLGPAPHLLLGGGFGFRLQLGLGLASEKVVDCFNSRSDFLGNSGTR